MNLSACLLVNSGSTDFNPFICTDSNGLKSIDPEESERILIRSPSKRYFNASPNTAAQPAYTSWYCADNACSGSMIPIFSMLLKASLGVLK